MTPKVRIPSYRFHRPSGQAVVTLNGKDHYLGVHNSTSSKTKYQQLVGEWLSRHHTPAEATPINGNDLSLAELMLAYLRHADTYYRDADGNPTGELGNVRYALRPLEALYAATSAEDFGPLNLKAVRQKMIADGLSRGVVNQRTGIIKRVFRWASAEGLISATIYHGLSCVEGLRRGRSSARETEPVRPVSEAEVFAIFPFLTPTVRAMVQLQWLTGMRSGELVQMRRADLDCSSTVWVYRPTKHKTAHHGHQRVIHIGAQGQQVLRPVLAGDCATFVFSPQRANEERYALLRKNRRSNVQPSQISRRKLNPARLPGERYDKDTYYRAISYAIRKARNAYVPIGGWHPHQLRHSAATRIRRAKGLDAARAVLGQKSLKIADTYAELDSQLAASVAADFC